MVRPCLQQRFASPTSPAITIATCSDVGAKGERTGLLYTMVAINGAIAFATVVLLVPFLNDNQPMSGFARISSALGSIIGSHDSGRRRAPAWFSWAPTNWKGRWNTSTC